LTAELINHFPFAAQQDRQNIYADPQWESARRSNLSSVDSFFLNTVNHPAISHVKHSTSASGNLTIVFTCLGAARVSLRFAIASVTCAEPHPEVATRGAAGRVVYIPAEDHGLRRTLRSGLSRREYTRSVPGNMISLYL
jgi:hypothetical protein